MHHLNGVKAMRKSILILCILIKFVFSSMVRYTICCKNTKFSWIKCKIIFFSAYKSKNGRQYPNGNQPEWECSDGRICIFFSSESFHDTFGRFWGKHVAQHGQARYPTWASTLPQVGRFHYQSVPKSVSRIGHLVVCVFMTVCYW